MVAGRFIDMGSTTFDTLTTKADLKELFKVWISLNTVKEILQYFRKQDRENPVRSDQRGLIRPISAPQ